MYVILSCLRTDGTRTPGSWRARGEGSRWFCTARNRGKKKNVINYPVKGHGITNGRPRDYYYYSEFIIIIVTYASVVFLLIILRKNYGDIIVF